MSRVYVGNLDPRVTERELEDEFRVYGVLQSVWVARKPPGYAFINFDERRDAQDAIHALDGKNGWRVELSHNSRGGGGGGGGGGSRGGGSRPRDRSGGSDMKCYECGEPGHFARECRLRVGSRGQGSGRRRSPSPRYRRSPSYGRRSYSPRDRSPRSRSVSPSRGRRSYSKSPARRGRDESPQLSRRGRDESPQPPRRGRDESPQPARRSRDESPQPARRGRDESPQPARRGRDESPPLPRRSRDESPQPARRGRDESPHANGNSAANDRHRSRS